MERPVSATISSSGFDNLFGEQSQKLVEMRFSGTPLFLGRHLAGLGAVVSLDPSLKRIGSDRLFREGPQVKISLHLHIVMTISAVLFDELRDLGRQ